MRSRAAFTERSVPLIVMSLSTDRGMARDMLICAPESALREEKKNNQIHVNMYMYM